MLVRTRFAPSPTGKLHLGGARTALFNFLFARSQNGVFLLRIEDTDRERSKKEYEQDIIESLSWLGLIWDEAIVKQSDRIDLYQKTIKELIERKLAYYCFCSKEELELRRQEQLSRGEMPRYLGICRNLSDEIVKKKISQKESYVIRLVVPEKIITFKDFLRGEIKFNFNQIGDFIIAKKGNFYGKNSEEPLYVLANTVDDHYQGITHIIRGEEFIPTTPKQLLIYKYFNWPEPIFVHLPLVLGQDRSKLSKRHGAKSIDEYRKEGYLPEAILNTLVLLGWHPGTNDEVIFLNEMIKKFRLEKLNKAPTIFNLAKMNYFNKVYLKNKSDNELLMLLNFDSYGSWQMSEDIKQSEFKANNGLNYSYEKILKIINLGKERASFLNDILSSVSFFFNTFDYRVELLVWQNISFKKIEENLMLIKQKLEEIDETNFTAFKIKEVLDLISNQGNKGDFFWPFRVALSGKEASPPPFEIAEIFGKKRTIELIEKALIKINQNENN